MKKKITCLMIVSTIGLAGCSSISSSDSVSVLGEHTDSFSELVVEEQSSSYVNSDTSENETQSTDENLETYVIEESSHEESETEQSDTETTTTENPLAFLQEDEHIKSPSNTTTMDQFELNQVMNAENTVSDNEVTDDWLKVSETYGIEYQSVITTLNNIAKEDRFSSVEVVDSTAEDTTTDKIIYIVRFDVYDYYTVEYYIGEGCTFSHDDTGYLASVYGDLEEDIEW